MLCGCKWCTRCKIRLSLLRGIIISKCYSLKWAYNKKHLLHFKVLWIYLKFCCNVHALLKDFSRTIALRQFGHSLTCCRILCTNNMSWEFKQLYNDYSMIIPQKCKFSLKLWQNAIKVPILKPDIWYYRENWKFLTCLSKHP